MKEQNNTTIKPNLNAKLQNVSLEKRKKMFKLFFMTLGSIFALYFIYWLFIGSRHVTTDNAYVAAEIAEITPAIEGTVKLINVVDTQHVKAGEVLVIIDDVDAKLALDRANADFHRAEADLERTVLDLQRRKKLSTSGSVSAEELSTAKNAYKVAEAVLATAKSTKEQAAVNLNRTIIKAPIDGVVARRQVQLGQRVMAGTHLLSIVPLDTMHVDANFKEVELAKVKVGQPVILTADIYGSSVKYHGKVIGFAGGTGAAFAIIPAQNATGNWIKVVQRVPVRIALESEELIKHPLRVGLSMFVDINVSN